MQFSKMIAIAAYIFLVIPWSALASSECLSLEKSIICTGEAHDSVIAKLPESFSTGQVVSSNVYGPMVIRRYNYHGENFTLTFGRTSGDSPHRLLSIRRNTIVGDSKDYVALKPFFIPLAESDGKRFITIAVEAETSDIDIIQQLHGNKVRDAVITLLGSKTYQDVASVEGKLSLKGEVMGAINSALGHGEITKLFITDMAIQ